MNIGFIVCICCCLLFLIFALIFTILKDKAAILISGFNSMSKDQRKMYDQKKMSKDQRNAFLIWMFYEKCSYPYIWFLMNVDFYSTVSTYSYCSFPPL